jgi:hypothetical protein
VWRWCTLKNAKAGCKDSWPILGGSRQEPWAKSEISMKVSRRPSLLDKYPTTGTARAMDITQRIPAAIFLSLLRRPHRRTNDASTCAKEGSERLIRAESSRTRARRRETVARFASGASTISTAVCSGGLRPITDTKV